jgi:hypothetical protein
MKVTLEELTEKRYSEIDSLMTNPELNAELNATEGVTFDQLIIKYIESIEAIQARFMHHGIDCPEQYQYLLSIMLTNN